MCPANARRWPATGFDLQTAKARYDVVATIKAGDPAAGARRTTTASRSRLMICASRIRPGWAISKPACCSVVAGEHAGRGAQLRPGQPAAPGAAPAPLPGAEPAQPGESPRPGATTRPKTGTAAGQGAAGRAGVSGPTGRILARYPGWAREGVLRPDRHREGAPGGRSRNRRRQGLCHGPYRDFRDQFQRFLQRHKKVRGQGGGGAD